jgi:hypothetical protein
MHLAHEVLLTIRNAHGQFLRARTAYLQYTFSHAFRSTVSEAARIYALIERGIVNNFQLCSDTLIVTCFLNLIEFGCPVEFAVIFAVFNETLERTVGITICASPNAGGFVRHECSFAVFYYCCTP